MTRESVIARTLVELAGTLDDDLDLVDRLLLLTDRCVEALDVQAAGIMLAGPDGQWRVMATSSEAVRFLEQFEVHTTEGPCSDCYRTGRAVVIQDLAAASDRWPRFAADALGAGFNAAHALPLHVHGSVIAVLCLFRTDVGEMVPADLEVAQAFADVTTIAISQHRAAREGQLLAQQLTHALKSRILLEQAKGKVAERLDVDMDRSFVAIRNHARSHNLRLSDVARSVIDGSLATSRLDAASSPPDDGVVGRRPSATAP